MKKFFSFFAALLFAGSMMADNTITFKAGEGSTDSSQKVSTVEAIVAEGADLVASVEAENVYNARVGRGIKLGTSSKTGALTLNLAEPVEAKALVVTARKYNDNEKAFTIQGQEFTAEDGDDFAEFTYAYEAPTQISSIALTCPKRIYFTSVKIVTDGEVTPPAPKPVYYVAGSMNGWAEVAGNAAYELKANPEAGDYRADFDFKANDELKVIGVEGETITWFPDGENNNYKITEDGDYAIIFNPAGNVEGWYEGFFQVLKKEEPVVGSYEVAEAIAAGLADDTEIEVRGIITKMEFKGKNFAKYGSVNIYVADATGAEGEFEFYNCYSLEADTFRASTPEFDPESTAWAQFTEVVDGNGVAIHVGDTVVAFGKYKLYNSTHELNTGCFLVDIKHAEAAEPVEHVVLGVNVPAVEGGVQAFGFAEEAVTMTLIDETGWYLSSDIYAKASDVFMLRDAANAESLLCKFYPADNEEGGVWVRLAITFGEVWADDTYKGDPVKFIELDMSDASLYAWKTEYDTIVPPVDPEIIELDVAYAEAAYIPSAGFWQFNLYKDWDGTNVTYPDLYIGVAPKSETAIAGSYSLEANEIFYIAVDLDENTEVEAVEASDLVVTCLGDGIYRYELEFVGDDNNIYILNVELETIAYNYETKEDIELTDEAEQGVEQTTVETKAVKSIVNGQLIIEKNGVRYSVLGQQVR